MIIYRYSDEDYEKCLRFSQELSKKTLSTYTNRNQGNLEKIIIDQTIGKIAEIANYHYIKTIDSGVSYPDLTIYDDRSSVSYDADLSSNDFIYHCKAQQYEQAVRYGLSWTFGINDPVIRRVTLKDIGVFSAINVQRKEVAICGIIPFTRIHQAKIFAEPILPKLRNFKRMIYYRDLKPYLKEQFQNKTYIN